MIKVVHISTHPIGGAGKAAFRQHQSLDRETEIESTFITAGTWNTNFDPDVTYNFPPKQNIMHRLMRKIGIRVSNHERNQSLIKDLKSNHEFFSFPKSDYALENLNIVKEADIINLHWVANFINFPTFFKRLKDKQIVWTMHDMNPFMGGFHYKNDSIKSKFFNTLDKKFLELKKKSIREAHNITVVTPSRWLMDEAIKSNVFSKYDKNEVIPYSVNLTCYKKQNKAEAKQHLGLSDTLPCILIIGQDLTNYRKGFDIFCKAVTSLDPNTFNVVTIGANQLDLIGVFKVKGLGTVSNDRDLSLAYSAADVVVLPSREDNLPNVMLESFACGTPVISFEVGGMKDWIIPGFNGMLVEKMDHENLAHELKKFIQDHTMFNADKIQEFAKINFSPEVQGKRYATLYRSLLT